MEDYEDGPEQAVPEPSAPQSGDALDSVVRPALVAATRLFLVAGVALVLVDETGELRGAVAAGDLAQALDDAAAQLWSGPSLEVLAGEGEYDALKVFFSVRRTTADRPELIAAVLSVGRTLLRIGAAPGRRLVQLAAQDPLTAPEVRAQLERELLRH